MGNLTNWMTQTAVMWYFGALGDTLLIVGIITAAMKVTIAGFTPVSWFLLAIACYLGLIWVVALRIMTHLEGRPKSW